MNDPPESELSEALRRAREAVELFMERHDAMGEKWLETSVTQVLLSSAWPEVESESFTQPQEKHVGADWVWWWVDSRGEAFGMLVQAKRLKIEGSAWSIDYDYGRGEQLRALGEAADVMRVPAAYALYLGTAASRAQRICGPGHSDGCARCRAATVSMVPAILVGRWAHSPKTAADLSLMWATPLELLGVQQPETPVWAPRLDRFSEELQKFVVDRQLGARAVARHFLDQVLEVRAGQFSLATDTRLPLTASDQVFTDLPDDRGHFGVPYFDHILRGLRTVPPPYVLEVMAGNPVPEGLPESVGGIVVVRC